MSRRRRDPWWLAPHRRALPRDAADARGQDLPGLGERQRVAVHRREAARHAGLSRGAGGGLCRARRGARRVAPALGFHRAHGTRGRALFAEVDGWRHRQAGRRRGAHRLGVPVEARVRIRLLITIVREAEMLRVVAGIREQHLRPVAGAGGIAARVVEVRDEGIALLDGIEQAVAPDGEHVAIDVGGPGLPLRAGALGKGARQIPGTGCHVEHALSRAHPARLDPRLHRDAERGGRRRPRITRALPEGDVRRSKAHAAAG